MNGAYISMMDLSQMIDINEVAVIYSRKFLRNKINKISLKNSQISYIELFLVEIFYYRKGDGVNPSI